MEEKKENGGNCVFHCIERHRASERERKGIEKEDYLMDLGRMKW